MTAPAARSLLVRRTVFVLALVAAIVTTATFGKFGAYQEALAGLEIHPHLPDLGLVATAKPAIQLHLATALLALAIGTVLLLGVKGNRLHRVLGWTWVIAMATTAVSSLFIHEINHGAFSFIHLLSGWTIIGLPMAVYAARRHKVAQHRRSMTGMFVGGLILAGLLAFLPGRLMWELFF
ncbi:DUF2306 domain-containing protein [Caulobacter sp. 17J65-9]|uniref:DUF2306 domain-containing protein n=1 Tax=Caulobacter sp. 17J65-9 TaxID=2709382 RepID=UPI0013CCD382|nr:DUF2306 domain-containing protein [Caulobacter sp. 17J65-9]NEX92705.1 DUF2306 domain-containing protein [Caulobacter sp. 17J65-9]